MIDILLNPKRAKRHPFELLVLAFIYSSISLLFSLWIFPDYASVVMIFLTVISCVYLVQAAMKIEENKDQSYKSEKWILKQHYSLFLLFLSLFFGFVFSFSFWVLVLPASKVSILFNLQNSIVEGIRSLVVTGNSIFSNTFLIIFMNNIKVLTISFIFALFYGAGSIYVLAWNASVLGYVIGSAAKSSLGIFSLPAIFFKYFLHGLPEMIGYILIALSGGILYVAVWKGDILDKQKKKRILFDCLVLAILSVLFIFFAAFIEVYISPFV